MRNARIEIDRIAFIQRVQLRPDLDFQFSLDHKQKFYAVVLMDLQVLRPDRLKFREERIQFSFGRNEIQALEEVRILLRSRTLRKFLSLRLPHNPDEVLLVFIGEEELQSNAKHHGNAQQRRQRREQLPALQFREQRRGKPSVFPKFHQTQLLLQPKPADLFPDLVRLQSMNNRLVDQRSTPTGKNLTSNPIKVICSRFNLVVALPSSWATFRDYVRPRWAQHRELESKVDIPLLPSIFCFQQLRPCNPAKSLDLNDLILKYRLHCT